MAEITASAVKSLRFLQVNNINAVAFSENVFFHLRIPTAHLMTEVNARFEQFLHCYCCQSLFTPYFYWFIYSPPILFNQQSAAMDLINE